MTENTLYLIAGLGNPGPAYRLNRHNVGFMVVNALAESAGILVRRVEQHALVGRGSLADAAVLLAKPQTYMNDSGQAVAPLLHFYKLPIDHLLVVHDDLDLPFGTLRMRPAGGTGGHRGMESIADQLGTLDFARLRVGIGRPPGRMGPRDYVLHDFDPPEQVQLPEMLATAAAAVCSFIRVGVEETMNAFNGNAVDED